MNGMLCGVTTSMECEGVDAANGMLACPVAGSR